MLAGVSPNCIKILVHVVDIVVLVKREKSLVVLDFLRDLSPSFIVFVCKLP